MSRILQGYSHEHRFSYWLDTIDLYIYQRDERKDEWIGWYASSAAWDRRMHQIMETK